MSDLDFDLGAEIEAAEEAGVEPAVSTGGSGAPLPDGWYRFSFESFERKPAKSNPRNEYLNVQLQSEDEAAGKRKLWVILNLWNESEEAVQIARGELLAMARSVGRKVKSHDELVGDHVDVRLVTDKGNTKKGYEPRNRIAEYAKAGTHSGKPGAVSSKPAPTRADVSTPKPRRDDDLPDFMKK